LYAYRALLEGFAVFEFTRFATESELDRLKNVMQKLRIESKAEDIKQVMAGVTEIYHIIFSGCRNKLVKENFMKLLDRINLLRAASLTQPNRIAIGVQEMVDMAEFIFVRDAEAAKQSAIVHVQEAAKAALASFGKD
jgi:DNA-binding GntR family transcriptional regulator